MGFIQKSLVVVLVLTFVVLISPVTASANDDITVIINGESVAFDDQTPIMVNGRVLVPVRFVFEGLGFDVDWNRSTSAAILERGNYTIVIVIGDSTFTVNGTSHDLDLPAQLINGRAMLPLGSILRAIGYDPIWSGTTRTVTISSTGNIPVPAIFDVLDDIALSILPSHEILQAANATENREFIRSAAEAGVPIAQLIYGMLNSLHAVGELTTEGHEYEALIWLNKAIDNGIVRAKHEIGEVYRLQHRDSERGDYWIRIAADLGVAVAQYTRANAYRWNYQRAVYFYRLAVEQGHIRAHIALGELVRRGAGTPQSIEEAMSLYRFSAVAGDMCGQRELAYMYLFGSSIGIPNYEQAIFWFRQAAELGENVSMFMLGMLYFEGRGVMQDYQQALYWFIKEAIYGFGLADEYRAILYGMGYYMTGVSQIYLLFGVEYTILPTVYEHDYPEWGDEKPYVTRWQFVEFHEHSTTTGFVNLDPSKLLPYAIELKEGDIFLITWGHNNRTYLIYHPIYGVFASRFIRG